MPEIKHYDGKKKHASKSHTKGSHEKPHHKRRPHREMEEVMTESDEILVASADIVDETEAINTEAQNEGLSSEEIKAEAEMIAEGGPAYGDEPSEHPEQEKIHLEFYGSEMIRQKAPKVMELADTVANEWVHDGRFEGLPVGHPLAQVAAAKALRTAKDVEKKLEEKGVFAMAQMGIDFVKAEINKRKKP